MQARRNSASTTLPEESQQAVVQPATNKAARPGSGLAKGSIRRAGFEERKAHSQQQMPENENAASKT